eukprot:SAG11_NODE_26300_length_347_cov_0.612903_2_plen_42_part_01
MRDHCRNMMVVPSAVQQVAICVKILSILVVRSGGLLPPVNFL